LRFRRLGYVSLINLEQLNGIKNWVAFSVFSEAVRDEQSSNRGIAFNMLMISTLK